MNLETNLILVVGHGIRYFCLNSEFAMTEKLNDFVTGTFENE